MAALAGLLDRGAITEVIPLVALRVSEKACGRFLGDARIRSGLLNMPRRRNVVPDVESTSVGTKLILLNREVHDLQLSGALPELRACASECGAVAVPYTLTLEYADFNAEDVLRRLLPEGMDVPASFETIGHIAHINLRTEQLPFKQLIGQVLLDKNTPRIRSVVNKVDTISNEFRVFPMELLAGDADMVAKVKQNGCLFSLDYATVYWNSRLEGEHARLVGLLRPRDVLLDMMAGIGPFAVPAAKNGVRVFANDLNPESHRWLSHNVQANGVQRQCTATCLDARDFMRQLAAAKPSGELAAFQQAAREPGARVHVAMNLPASALEFLDVFVRLFRRSTWPGALPTVHCYCFSKAREGAVADVRQRATAVLGASLEGRSEVHVVRDVAPGKLMLCISFELPEEVGWMREGAEAEAAAPGAAQAEAEGAEAVEGAEEGRGQPKRARTQSSSEAGGSAQ